MKDKETVTISAIDTIFARLAKIDSEWKKEEKAKIRTNLESLQTKIADIFLPPTFILSVKELQ